MLHAPGHPELGLTSSSGDTPRDPKVGTAHGSLRGPLKGVMGGHTFREGSEGCEKGWCAGLGPQESPQEVVSVLGRMPASGESVTRRTKQATRAELCTETTGQAFSSPTR